MADAPESKNVNTQHIEETHERAQFEDTISKQEHRDAEQLQEKYHIPMKEALESHLDQDSPAVRRIMRKVDWRLVPMLSLLYMWAFIDRANLGNVRDTRLDCTSTVAMT